MIEFLQDYTTKSVPPETFKDEQRVERSAESELYFVRLGIAAYVTETGLVDADYRAVERATLATIIEAIDPRSLPVGRAGEIPVTVAAPVRASTGPGNAALFGGDQQTAALATQVEALTDQLADARADIPPAPKVTTPLEADIAIAVAEAASATAAVVPDSAAPEAGKGKRR